MKNKVKAILIGLSKKSSLFKTFLRVMLKTKNNIVRTLYVFNKVDEKLVIFESFMGRNYACSPRAIYEELLKDNKYKDYKFIWAFREPSKYKDTFSSDRTTVIKYNSLSYYKAYSKAKYWVTNSRIPVGINKKKGQVYLQCWHGTPLKRLGHDIIEETKNALNNKEEMIKKYDDDANKYDYFISPSKFATEKFISAFGLKQKNKENIIIEQGYPRNDFLYNYKEKDVKRIKKELGIPLNKKVIFYLPTWRDDQHSSGLGYTYKTEVDFDYLKKELGDEYIILFSPHYFVANSFDFEKYKGFVYNLSISGDINDVYIISDILITDYSSVFFDYANLKRPMIFYMYDLEYYANNLRGFYIDLKELPGDIVKEEKEIVKIVKNLDKYNKKHEKKYKAFNNKFNYLDDGKAAKRVIEKVFR